MSAQRKRLLEVRLERLVLVEGESTRKVVTAFLRHVELPGIQVEDFGGVSDLTARLRAAVDLPGFFERVRSLGIIRDAERDAAAAFQSVQSSLDRAQLVRPEAPGVKAEGKPSVSVLILPDNSSPGMLETLCLRSVSNDPAFSCIGEMFQCFERAGGTLPANMDKARTQAFLSTRPEPNLPVGIAGDLGYWSWDSAAFSPLRKFLEGL